MRLISIPIALGNLKKICDKWQAKWQLQLQPVQWRAAQIVSRRVWTANSDGTLTPELMAVNPESIPSKAKVESITHSLSA